MSSLLPLAKFWTFIGQAFVPFGATWIYLVRTGPDPGVLITRAYFGLGISLLVGAALVWSLALYVRAARLVGTWPLIPPNTTFEDMQHRSRLLSWGTLAIFVLSLGSCIVVFGIRYGESNVYRWGAEKPLANSFLQSRIMAHNTACSSEPCFAMAQQASSSCKTGFGVAQYFTYISDGVLLGFALIISSGLIFLIFATTSRTAKTTYEL